jgi:hypothetical protein
MGLREMALEVSALSELADVVLGEGNLNGFPSYCKRTWTSKKGESTLACDMPPRR